MKRTISSANLSLVLEPKKKIKKCQISYSSDTLRDKPKILQFNDFEYLYPLLENLNVIVLDFKEMNGSCNNFLEQYLLYIVFKDCSEELFIKTLNHLEFHVKKICYKKYYLKKRNKSEIVKLVLSELSKCRECIKFLGRMRTIINLDYSIVKKYTSIDRFNFYLSSYNDKWINVSYSQNTRKVSILIK